MAGDADEGLAFEPLVDVLDVLESSSSSSKRAFFSDYSRLRSVRISTGHYPCVSTLPC